MAENARSRRKRERARAEAAHRRSIGLAAVGLGLVVALFAVYVVYAAFPGRGDGLPVKGGAGRALNALVPQGWAFFTTDPRSTAYVAYRHTDAGWTPTLSGPLASPRYGWGFDRAPRFQDQQVQSVVAGIDPRYWRACSPQVALSDVESCLDADGVGVYASNPWPVPALCGRVAVVAAQPAAWADARSGTPALAATRVLNVDLRC